MGRPKSTKPSLYQRGKEGNLFFRRFVGGKDTEINTGTNDRKTAEQFRQNYIELETATKVELTQGGNPMRVASTIIKTITGKSVERITFADGYQIYVDHTSDYEDLSAGYRTVCESIYRSFSAWCAEQKLQYMDEVTQSIATRYAKMIWESGLSEATHDSYVKTLSKIFALVDVMKNLPNRNPFHEKIVKRRRQGPVSEATHQPFEPYMLEAVMKEAAATGEDWFDLFLASSTLFAINHSSFTHEISGS